MSDLRLALTALFVTAIVAGNDGVLKVQSLMRQLDEAQKTHAKVSFEVTEKEYNDYLVWTLGAQPRPGVEKITLKFFPDNYVSSFTIVDLDAVQRWKPDAIPAMLRPVMHGQRSFWVDVRFRVRDGMMTYTVEKAYVENVRIPAIVVQEVIRIVAANQPEHYDTSKPLTLPFGLRNLLTEQGRAKGSN